MTKTGCMKDWHCTAEITYSTIAVMSNHFLVKSTADYHRVKSIP